MAQHNDLGKEGESIARMYLMQNGYEIIDQNYRYQKGEIDLIALKDDLIVFIEVKTRQSKEIQDPLLSVTKRKQKLIIKTADAYIKENDIDLEARFDIISILTNKYESEIEHIDGAFYPTL